VARARGDTQLAQQKAGEATAGAGVAAKAVDKLNTVARSDSSPVDLSNALDLGDCPYFAVGFQEGKTYVCACPAGAPAGMVFGSGVHC
jgi:hypothetical protein